LGGSWRIKFEGRFKYRDESEVNAPAASRAAKSGKRLFDGDFRAFAEFGLPCHFAKR
jgi:hypothetical protein